MLELKVMRICIYLAVLLCLALALCAMPALADANLPYNIDVDIANQIVTI